MKISRPTRASGFYTRSLQPSSSSSSRSVSWKTFPWHKKPSTSNNSCHKYSIRKATQLWWSEKIITSKIQAAEQSMKSKTAHQSCFAIARASSCSASTSSTTHTGVNFKIAEKQHWSSKSRSLTSLTQVDLKNLAYYLLKRTNPKMVI